MDPSAKNALEQRKAMCIRVATALRLALKQAAAADGVSMEDKMEEILRDTVGEYHPHQRRRRPDRVGA